MTYYYNTAEGHKIELAPGITLRVMSGAKIMMSLVEIAPNSTMSPHSHSNEQAGVVMKGQFEFTIGGETRTVKEGDAYIIPSNIEHSLSSGNEGATALDIFCPPRKDYRP